MFSRLPARLEFAVTSTKDHKKQHTRNKQNGPSRILRDVADFFPESPLNFHS